MYLVNTSTHGQVWRCNGIVDRTSSERCCNGSMRSLTYDSFFAKRRISNGVTLRILFLWVHRVRRGAICSMLGLQSRTVAGVLNDFLQLVHEDLTWGDVKIGMYTIALLYYILKTALGGPGVIVEIDESKFGKRKYHRGHRVEGVWVVGGVEITGQRRCFMMTVKKRDHHTLASIIANHVLPGSIVRTDCWAAYNGIDEIPGVTITHQTVNHSEGFINSEGVHTNTIEG